MTDEIIANAFILFVIVIPLVVLLIPLLFLAVAAVRRALKDIVAAIRRALKDIYELYWQD